MAKRKETRDYFAEQFVAGVFADAEWNIYFPRRDIGFDFIVSKTIGDSVVIRPIQVKGKYPGDGKKDKPVYGWIGPLSAVHKDMVLVIPYFAVQITSPSEAIGTAPSCIAFMPRNQIRPQASRDYACQPAKLQDGVPKPRRDFCKYFDAEGLQYVEDLGWGKQE